MWAFLSRRFRRWVLLAVAVPLLGRALERAGGAIEERRGETSVTRGCAEWATGWGAATAEQGPR